MSAAQNAARTRNWRIRNLRALYELCRQLSPASRATAQFAIDCDLRALGALTGPEHYAKAVAEFEKLAEDGGFEEVPF